MRQQRRERRQRGVDVFQVSIWLAAKFGVKLLIMLLLRFSSILKVLSGCEKVISVVVMG